MAKTEHLHITVAEGVCGGAPIIRGTRTSVAHIAGYYRLGLSPEEIQRELPHLTLAYYFDHVEEIDLGTERELEAIVSREYPPGKS